MAVLKRKNKRCIICDNLFPRGYQPHYLWQISSKYTGIPDIPDAGLCGDCYEALRYTFSMGEFYEKIPKNPKRCSEDYLKIRTYLVENQKKLKSSWLKDELYYMIAKADEESEKYNLYDDVFKTACDKIESSYSSLPEKVFHYGTSTFAVDDTTLYYMPCGKPIAESDELKNIVEPQARLESIDFLKENVIEKENLYETIELDNILYYQEKGDIGYVSDISGGEGGDPNIGRAVVGGVIFGIAGAIIGSKTGEKAKTKAISSKIVERDNRYVILRYLDSGGKTIERKCEYGYYDVFSSLIPEKEYSYIQFMARTEKEKEYSDDPYAELKKLKELLDTGVINENDFEKKKKQLLNI